MTRVSNSTRNDATRQDALPLVDGYAIERRLGEGGMGVVYRARDLGEDRVVALKMLRRVDPAGIYKLKREFRSLADIAHPNLVRLYELRCVDERWFFTMELVEGRPFLDYLGADPWGRPEPTSGITDTVDLGGPELHPVPLDGAAADARLRDAFAQLVQGVAAVHRAGKVHCDLKPSNLIVDATGRVVVLDFGVSSVFGAFDPFPSLEFGAEGTPEYMSPEQILGEPLGPASDLYAIGTILYEALAGARPFVGPRSALMVGKLGAPPPRPSASRPDVASDLDSLCMDLLTRAPDQRPSAEQVLARLASRGPSSPPPSPRAPLEAAQARSSPAGPVSDRGVGHLVGREAELAWLRAAAADVGPQQPVVALVTGASGIGKSALVDAFARELMDAPGGLVLRGRCYESESVPYKAFDPVVDELARFLCRLSDRDVAELLPRDIRALGRVFPVLNRVGAIATAGGRSAEGDLVMVRRRASKALKDLLARLADRWRLAVVVDDLHWGDVDSAALLLDVLEPPDAPAVVVLLAAQDVGLEMSPMLRALFGESAPTRGPIARRLHVEALPHEHAARLAGDLLGERATPGLLDAIASESGGSPFFLRELAELAVPKLHEKSSLDGASVRLEPLLRSRIESLRPDLREALELVAIAGRPVPHGVVAALIEGGRGALLCAELRGTHLVRTFGITRDWSVECFHDRVRATTVAAMPPERVAACHRRLATVLEASGSADPEVLLEHYRRADDLASARRHVVASADAAREALAFSRAVRLYQMALDLTPREQWSTLGLQARVAEALALEGRLREAGGAYREAARSASGLDAVELRRLSAQHFLTGGDLAAGLDVLQGLLRDLDLTLPASPTAAIGRLVWARTKVRMLGLRFRERAAGEVPPQELARVDACFSAAVGLAMSDVAVTAALSAEHLLLALRSGEPMRIARGLAFEMSLAPAAGEEGLRWATRALPVAEQLSDRSDDAYLRGLFFLAQGHVAYFSGQWRAATDWMTRADAALRGSRTSDVHWALQSANVLESHATAAAGDLPAVESRLPGFLKEARRRGDLHSLSLFVYPGILVDLARDRVDAARALLRDTARERPGTTFDVRDFGALHGAMLVDRYEGRPEVAWKRLSSHWGAILRSKILVVNIIRATLLAERGTAALAMARGPDGGDCIRIAKDCARKLQGEKLRYPRALAGVLRARISHVLGDKARALTELTEASLALEEVGLGNQATCSRRVIGALMGGNMGRVLVAEMDETLKKQGVAAPERFVELMIPGFGGALGLPGS